MNESIKKGKSEANNKEVYKQTSIRRPIPAQDIRDGQTRCPTCLQDLQEDEAMETRGGVRVHEDCYEPGESNY